MLVGVVALSVSNLSTSGEIFRSVATDGSVRYASQAIDSSYELMESGPTTTPQTQLLLAVSPPTSPKTKSIPRAIASAAQKHGLDPFLLDAIVAVESNHRANAVSPKGARGLDGNVALALAAYNAGEGAVARHGTRIPPYAETKLYVSAVLSRASANQRR